MFKSVQFILRCEFISLDLPNILRAYLSNCTYREFNPGIINGNSCKYFQDVHNLLHATLILKAAV